MARCDDQQQRLATPLLGAPRCAPEQRTDSNKEKPTQKPDPWTAPNSSPDDPAGSSVTRTSGRLICGSRGVRLAMAACSGAILLATPCKITRDGFLRDVLAWLPSRFPVARPVDAELERAVIHLAMVKDALQDPPLSFGNLLFDILRRCFQLVGVGNGCRGGCTDDAVHSHTLNDVAALD